MAKGITKMTKRGRDPPASPRWVRMNAPVTIIAVSKVTVFRGIEKMSTGCGFKSVLNYSP
jgi:hypothetical protein